VQEKSPQQWKQEETKQRAWEEQRGKPAPPANPRQEQPRGEERDRQR